MVGDYFTFWALKFQGVVIVQCTHLDTFSCPTVSEAPHAPEVP